MIISRVRTGSVQHEYTSFNKRTPSAEKNVNRNTGPDTATLSDEARALALGNATTIPEPEDDTFPQALLQEKEGTQPSTLSLKEKRLNLFAMLLESLLLAELDAGETKPTADATPDSAATSKQGSLLEDSEKVAALKKTMQDVMTGKKDLSDLPQAMARRPDTHQPAGAAAKTGEAEKNKDAKTQSAATG